ncbi:hypothetical protein IWGMT90018_19010 [Mycobacterium kiyosense]|nr:hypothetical protein IWGMT90018_19010 [Mycobacterium kiyosense]
MLLGGRRPNTADLDYHLTTLFPPVRPRGRLEIRYLDSVLDVLWPAVVFTLVTLLDDGCRRGLRPGRRTGRRGHRAAARDRLTSGCARGRRAVRGHCRRTSTRAELEDA